MLDIIEDVEPVTQPIVGVLQRLENIERLVKMLVERQTVKDWYTPEELASIVKRGTYAVQQWCRNHRINAVKKATGRGSHTSWAISNEELLRFQRDGLLPRSSTRTLAA
jgi:hypothetical protein